MPPGAPRAAVLLSGNELLDGRTTDTNGAFVCADLSRRGVKVLELLTVADDRARIVAALRHALDGEPDLLVLGGGLGTTHDDLTAECLAEVLGVALEEDPRALAYLEERVRAVAARRHMDFARDVPPRAAPGQAAGGHHRRAAGRRSARHRRAGRGRPGSSRTRACPTNFSRCGSRRRRPSSVRASSRTSPRAWSASSASESCRSAPCSTRCRTTSSSWASTSAGER